MSTTALQAKRAITVIPSDTIDIPLAGAYLSGVDDGTAAPTKLVDAAATFITSGVSAGDIIYDDTGGLIATVVSVDFETELTVSLVGMFIGAGGDVYSIYSPGNNNGATLYVGGAGDVTVITMGGDQVTLTAVPAGSFVPVQVTRVLSTGTTATDMLALW